MLISSVIFLSCEEKRKPFEPVLSEEKMTEILTLLYTGEVKTIKMYDLSVQKNEYLKEYLYPAIFDSLNVDDSLFYQSYQSYENNPEKMKELMDKVIVTLEAMVIDSVSHEVEERSLEDAYKEIDQLEKMQKDNAKQRFDNRLN